MMFQRLPGLIRQELTDCILEAAGNTLKLKDGLGRQGPGAAEDKGSDDHWDNFA